MPKKEICITFNPESKAPLFRKLPLNLEPQPAYVTLDLRTGDVDAYVSNEVGNGMPADVWNGLVRRYPIRQELDSEQAREALEGVRDTLQTIYGHSEVVHDGSNWVGRLDETAKDAERELDFIGEKMEGRVIPDLADALLENGEAEWIPNPDQDVDAFARELESRLLDQEAVFHEDVKDVLLDLWSENLLYNGDPLPKNVARALLEDGRCEDSEWMEELRSYAEGRDPEQQDLLKEESGPSRPGPVA